MNIFPFILQTLIWIPTRILFEYFGHIKVYGRENIKGLEENVIFAMNHTSEIDPIILPALLNPFSKLMPMHYVSLERKFYEKKFGWRSYLYGGTFFKALGAYPALKGTKNYEKALKHHICLLKKGKNVLIFPEGKRSHDAGIQPARGGVIYLSQITGKKIVPVAVSGHFNMSFKDLIRRKRHIYFSFGKPLSPEELFIGYENPIYEDYRIIAHEKVMVNIAKMLDHHMIERGREQFVRDIAKSQKVSARKIQETGNAGYVHTHDSYVHVGRRV